MDEYSMTEEMSESETPRHSMQRLVNYRNHFCDSKSQSVPDTINTPNVVVDMGQGKSEADFELGEEYEITFEAKPFGFSIIEDEYGENAFIDGIQKDWLEEQGLRMNSQVMEIDGVDVVSMQYGDIIDTMRAAQLPCIIRFRYSVGPDLPPEEDER